MMSRATLLKILLLFVASSLFSFFLQRIFHIGLADIRVFVTSAGIWAPLVYSGVLFLGLTVPFNPISDSITVSIAALIFPPFVAIIMTFIAHSFSLIFNYSLSRTWGDDLLRKLISKKEVEKIQRLGSKINALWIFGFRFLLPLNAIGFDFISYAAGISKMNFAKFYLASIIPWTILNILFFSSSSFLRDINPGMILLPLLGLAIAPGIYFAFKNKESFKKNLKKLFKDN